MEDELEKKRKIEANAQKIADSATVRNKLAQQAESTMAGSGEKIKDKKTWLDFKKNSEEGNPPSPIESFMEGMSYFTPELMGGLFGSWAHSPEVARKTMKPIRDAEAKLAEVESKADQGLSNYQLASLKMQKDRLTQREKETDLMTGRFSARQKQRRMEQIAKREAKEDVFVRSKRNLGIMKDILKDNPEGFTGPFDVLKQKVAQAYGRQSPEFTNFQQAATDFSSNYVKQISGVAVSEAEQKRLKQALPGTDAQENVNMTRINSLISLMDMIEKRNAKIKARVGGTLPKGKKIKDYIRKDEEIDVDAVLSGKIKSKPKLNERSDFERLKRKYK
jgi:hypothetical protein